MKERPALARGFLKLAAITWGLHFLLWETDVKILKVLSGFPLLGAVFFSALFLFQAVITALTRLPKSLQSVAQVVIALVSAALPLCYFLPVHAELWMNALILALEPFIRSWAYWVIYGFFAWIVWVSAQVSNPELPLSRYLVLVAIVFAIAFIGGHGGFQSMDEDGYSLSDEAPSTPESSEGKMHMAGSYLRLFILGYATLFVQQLWRIRRDQIWQRQRELLLAREDSHNSRN